LMRREALVRDELVGGRLVEEPGALLDGALQRIAGHRGLLRLLDREAEARIALRIRPACLRRDGELLGELGEEPALRVRALLAPLLLPLCAHGSVLAPPLRARERRPIGIRAARSER